jgi:hypothetical protein
LRSRARAATTAIAAATVQAASSSPNKASAVGVKFMADSYA